MRILIHAANLTIGGGLTVGKEILQAWKTQNVTVFVLASPAVAAFLEAEKTPENWRWETVPYSPGKSLASQRSFHKKAVRVEKTFRPDVVFTIFGPPLWKPRAPHLCGFANGLYFPENPVLPFGEKPSNMRTLKHHARRMLVFRSMEKDTDMVWIETETARKKLRAIVGEKEVLVIPNELSALFKEAVFTSPTPAGNRCRVLLLAAGYPHKNFALLQALSEIPGIEKDFVFRTTLPEAAFQLLLKKSPAVENLGLLSGKDLLAAYHDTDIVFCPSVAEIFSATWMEAMAAKRPLLCADIPEARDICGDAALYFDGHNPQAALAALRRVRGEEDLRKKLVENGTKRLQELTPDISRADKILVILKGMGSKKNALSASL